MPAPRARRAVLLLAVAGALGTAGCTDTVDGAAAPAAPNAAQAGAVGAAAGPAGSHCPSAATLRAALPSDGAGGTYRLSGPVLCSGDWAVANPLYTAADPRGDDQPVSVTLLFHRVGDGWQPVDRAPLCADGTVPAAIYELTCESN